MRRGDGVDGVRRLKASDGAALYVWGSGKLLQTLIGADNRQDLREPLWHSPRPMTVTEPKMTLRKISLACIASGIALLNIASAPALATDCREPQTGTKDVSIFSPPLANVVTGAGRLQFYSAPNDSCPMSGIFVIPKDELIAYAETNTGWSSVMYTNPRTNNVVSGWVRSARLKQTGTVGPRQ